MNHLSKKIIAVISVLFLSSNANAALQGSEEVVKAPVVDVAVESESDELRFTARYPNSCYEPWTSIKKVSEDRLVLLHLSEYDTDSVCNRVINYVEFAFDINKLSDGEYEVIDGYDGETIEVLQVKDEQVQLVQ